jgi:hypothetical protein
MSASASEFWPTAMIAENAAMAASRKKAAPGAINPYRCSAAEIVT